MIVAETLQTSYGTCRIFLHPEFDKRESLCSTDKRMVLIHLNLEFFCPTLPCTQHAKEHWSDWCNSNDCSSLTQPNPNPNPSSSPIITRKLYEQLVVAHLTKARQTGTTGDFNPFNDTQHTNSKTRAHEKSLADQVEVNGNG